MADGTVLQVAGIRKSYGATQALAGIDFIAPAGRILAVLGENGAGKSTLVKILAGSVRPDAGEIRFDGTATLFRSPREALRSGVVLIPQELAYAPDLSIAENVFLGRTNTRWRLSSQPALERRAAPHLARVGLALPASRRLRDLTVGQQQLVEIAKALARDVRVLLMDEPTAALTSRESENLFDTLGRLRRQGVITLLISHRLEEVVRHADDVLVLRDGRVARHTPAAATTKAQMIADMLGHDLVRPAVSSTDENKRDEMLGARGLQIRPGSPPLDVVVRRGEIVALFGIRGAGQDDVVQTLAGLQPHAGGELRLDGRRVAPLTSPRRAHDCRIAYVPPDRKRLGLMLNASVSRNLALPALRSLSRAGVVSPGRERSLVNRYARLMQLKYREARQPVRELSGGNQQKVLLGGRLALESKVLVLHEPTRGVDLGARQQIHELVQQIAQERGTAVVVATTDVDEVVELSHAAYVFRASVIVQTLRGRDLTTDHLLIAAQGD